jgi:dipeptidyl aminopeptidase/acylaminoacyl peptidase
MMNSSRVTAGTTAAADDLERSVASMAKIGASWSPRFSPDGTRMVFVSNLNGSPQVWTMPSTGGFPRLVTAFDDPVGFVTWSPDGQWLAFNVAPGGGLNEQIYLARPDGSGLRRLTEGGTENNFLGGWTPDGRSIFFSSNRRRGASTDSYLITAPTIVLHGANDTNVPVVEAEQVVEQLKKRHVPVEYVLFPDKGHGWRKMPNRIRSVVAIVRFFETHLKAS